MPQSLVHAELERVIGDSRGVFSKLFGEGRVLTGSGGGIYQVQRRTEISFTVRCPTYAGLHGQSGVTLPLDGEVPHTDVSIGRL